MRLNRGHGQVQGGGDLGVGAPGRDLLEHLAFAVGQRRENVAGRRSGGARPSGELGDQPAGDGGGEQRLARGDDRDGVEQLFRRGVFQHEPAGAAAERLEDVLVLVEGGDDEDPGRRILIAVEDELGCLKSAHDRHPDVHQDHVRLEGPGLADGLDAVAGLADHGEAGRGVDQDHEPGPDQRLVVGDQHPDVARPVRRHCCP